MASKKDSLDKLDYAVTSLNEDAENLHALIANSTEELKKATKAGNEASKQADNISKSLSPLTRDFETQIRQCSDLVNETKITQFKLIESLNQTLSDGTKKQEESFASFIDRSSKESERTRDILQSDMLSSKNNMSLRLDGFENELGRLTKTINETREENIDRIQAIPKKLTPLICGAIAFGAIDFICLIVLLIR